MFEESSTPNSQEISNDKRKRKKKQDPEFVEDYITSEEEVTSDENLPTPNLSPISSPSPNIISDTSQDSLESNIICEKRSTWISEHINRIDDTKVICLICNKELKFKRGGSNSNIHKHPCFVKLKTEGFSGSKKLNSNKIYGPRLPSRQQNYITSLLKNWLILNEKPFRITRDENFKKFILALNNSYRIPSPNTIKELIMKDLGYLRTYLKQKLLPKLENFSLSVDLFTSDADDHLMCVTIHFFEVDSGKLKSKVLFFKDCTSTLHVTGKEISKVLKSELKELNSNIDRVLVITSDSGSNVKNAIEEELKITFNHCIPHKLNLIVNTGFQEIFSLLDKCKSMVSFVNKSSVVWSLLKEHQKQSNNLDGFSQIVYKLVQENTTRWNSTLALFERIDLLMDDLNKTMNELNKEEFYFNETEISQIKEVIEVLKPFEIETKYFSSEKTSTISKVWPRLSALILTLEEMNINDENIKKMKLRLIQSLKIRCENVFKDDYIIISTILDPIFKLLYHVKESSRQEYYDIIIKEGIKIIQTSPISSNIPQIVIEKQDNVSNALKKMMNITKPVVSSDEIQKVKIIKAELASYFTVDTPNVISLDPLVWWWEKRDIFPHLSQIAFKYLVIPSSSASVERRFSSVGRNTNCRWRMKPETIEALVTLKDWLEDVDYQHIFNQK